MAASDEIIQALNILTKTVDRMREDANDNTRRIIEAIQELNQGGDQHVSQPQQSSAPARNEPQQQEDSHSARAIGSSRWAYCRCDCRCWSNFDSIINHVDPPACCSCEIPGYQGGRQACGCRSRNGEWLTSIEQQGKKKYRWAKS